MHFLFKTTPFNSLCIILWLIIARRTCILEPVDSAATGVHLVPLIEQPLGVEISKIFIAPRKKEKNEHVFPF